MPETPEAKCLQPLPRVAREPNSKQTMIPSKTHTTKCSSALRLSSHATPGGLLLGAWVYHGKIGMLEYYRSRMACLADCGKQNSKLCCSMCKITRTSLSLSLDWHLADKCFVQATAAHLVNRRTGRWAHDFNFPYMALVSQHVLWNGEAHSRRIPTPTLRCKMCMCWCPNIDPHPSSKNSLKLCKCI